MPAWTQYASVAWRRSLVSFVSQHPLVLQDLDKAGLIRRFDVGSERVGVKLGDGLHHLIFSPDHITVAALTRNADLDLLLRAAQIVWRRMGPDEVVRGEINVRLLTPVEGDYDSARRSFGDRIVDWPDGMSNVDSAVSVDLWVAEFEADLHAEYGIVKPSEAADRLAFQQPPVVEDAGVAPTIFPLKSLPAAALFDNQTWRLSAIEIVSADAVFALWSRIRDRAEEVDVAISKRLVGDKDEHRNGS